MVVTKTKENSENCNENKDSLPIDKVTNLEKENISTKEPISNHLHFNIRFNPTQSSELFELMKLYQYGKKSETLRRAVSEAIRFNKLKENICNSKSFKLMFEVIK